MGLPAPSFADASVTLYHGDALAVVPEVVARGRGQR